MQHPLRLYTAIDKTIHELAMNLPNYCRHFPSGIVLQFVLERIYFCLAVFILHGNQKPIDLLKSEEFQSK